MLLYSIYVCSSKTSHWLRHPHFFQLCKKCKKNVISHSSSQILWYVWLGTKKRYMTWVVLDDGTPTISSLMSHYFWGCCRCRAPSENCKTTVFWIIFGNNKEQTECESHLTCLTWKIGRFMNLLCSIFARILQKKLSSSSLGIRQLTLSLLIFRTIWNAQVSESLRFGVQFCLLLVRMWLWNAFSVVDDFQIKDKPEKF